MLRRFRPLLIAFSLVAFLSACGSGGDAEEQAVTPSDGVWIVSPTPADAYETNLDAVHLQGGAFVPAGSECPNTIARGYSVTWVNATTGGSGDANVSLGCLLQVNIVWETYPITLAVGTNPITVTARDAQGRVAVDTLVVTRLPQ